MKYALVAVILAILAALLLVLAGPGVRFGLWEYGTGFLMMRWALFLGIAAAALALLLLIMPGTRQGRVVALSLALVVGLGAAWFPWHNYQTVQALPFIHDITTDPDDPPRFVDVAPLRADAPNPVAYPGEETAAQQRAAYPDIQPLEVGLPSREAFDRALQTARDQGWEIVAAEPGEGRIEATATTFWFGFKDDVVIRITPSDSGSRLDVRSKSRVGRSDVGTNAARIRDFLADFQGRA